MPEDLVTANKWASNLFNPMEMRAWKNHSHEWVLEGSAKQEARNKALKLNSAKKHALY